MKRQHRRIKYLTTTTTAYCECAANYEFTDAYEKKLSPAKDGDYWRASKSEYNDHVFITCSQNANTCFVSSESTPPRLKHWILQMTHESLSYPIGKFSSGCRLSSSPELWTHYRNHAIIFNSLCSSSDKPKIQTRSAHFSIVSSQREYFKAFQQVRNSQQSTEQQFNQ